MPGSWFVLHLSCVAPRVPTLRTPCCFTAENVDRFTLTLNSYKRHDLLQRSIVHYAACPTIDAIRVVRPQVA